MALYSKLRGTFETLWQIGKGGPQWKNNAGPLEARNATDAAFQIVRGATPVGADDLVTKAYADALPGTLTPVFDFDFTAQPNQTLSPDGNYVIGGKTWTKANSANETANTVITAGTGLVFHPNGASNYDQALNNRSAPWLWLPFSQLTIPTGFTFGSRYRLFLSLGAGTNFAATFDGCFFGLQDQNGTVVASVQNVGASGTGLAGFYTGNWGGTRWSTGQSAATQLTALHVSTVYPGQSTLAYSGTLAAGAAFPSAASFVNPAIQFNSENGDQGTLTINQLGLLIGAKRAGSGTALTVVVQRVRLELGN